MMQAYVENFWDLHSMVTPCERAALSNDEIVALIEERKTVCDMILKEVKTLSGLNIAPFRALRVSVRTELIVLCDGEHGAAGTGPFNYIKRRCKRLWLDSKIQNRSVRCDLNECEGCTGFHTYNDLLIWPEGRSFLHNALTETWLGATLSLFCCFTSSKVE